MENTEKRLKSKKEKEQQRKKKNENCSDYTQATHSKKEKKNGKNKEKCWISTVDSIRLGTSIFLPFFVSRYIQLLLA